MGFINPYEALIGERDPVDVLFETAREVTSCVRGWTPVQFNDTYAPGKRTGQRILLHLLHVELVDGVRLRMALTDSDYVVQPFDADAWMLWERLYNGPLALAAWSAMRAVNLALWRTVTPAQLERPFEHPECGRMTPRHLAAIWAGHDLHHLHQLRAIGGRRMDERALSDVYARR